MNVTIQALVYMVIPAMADGVALEDTYCDGLRGNYNTEYPEDADLNHEMCTQFVGFSQQMADIEDDAEKMKFMAQVLREAGGDENLALAEQTEQAAQAMRDGDIEGIEDVFQELHRQRLGGFDA